MNTKVYNIQVFVNNNKYLKTIVKDLDFNKHIAFAES